MFTDPTGRDIVAGTGDQGAVRAALISIASHPGGREFLTKVDRVTAKITVSTGRNLKDEDGLPAYGKTGPAPGSDGRGKRVVGPSGNIVDIKSPDVAVTVDFDSSREDRKKGLPEAFSDSKLLGHELKHAEAAYFDLPNSEEDVDTGIDKILNTPESPSLKKDATAFVDDLLKVNSPPSPPQDKDKTPKQ